MGSGLGGDAWWIGAKCDGCHVRHVLSSLQKQAWKSVDATFVLAERERYNFLYNIAEAEMKINSPWEHSTLFGCRQCSSEAAGSLAHGVAARPGSERQCHCTMCITLQPLASAAWPGSPCRPSAPPFPLGIVGGSRSVQAVKELQNFLQKSGISLDMASASVRA